MGLSSRETPRHRRADANRSRAAVLDAAARLLNDRPDTSMEAVAAEAGVTRQTVYAHFPSRDDLVAAVVDKITEVAIAAMDAADPDDGPAAAALLRMLDASRQVTEQYPGLVVIASEPVSAEIDRARHTPVTDRLKRVIRRGQEAGEFAPRPSPDWMAAAAIALGHAAYGEVIGGRMSRAQAEIALHTSLLRVVGAADPSTKP
jgi:AcrR family transcriptional regulator